MVLRGSGRRQLANPWANRWNMKRTYGAPILVPMGNGWRPQAATARQQRHIAQLLGGLAVLVGACVVRPDHGLARLTDAAPVRWVGTVSYGMYLLHVSAITAARRLLPVGSSVPVVFAVAAAGSWNADRGWAGADLTPVRELAARSGVQLQIRDDAGHPISTTPGFAATGLEVPAESVTVEESDVPPTKLTFNGRLVFAVSASLYAPAFTPSVAVPALALEMVCGFPFKSCASRINPPVVEPLVFASIA